MISRMYPFWSFLTALVLAQLMKPFVAKMQGDKFSWKIALASGGFPSSHSASVTALCFSVGILEHFDSTIFAVTLALAVIVCYDAMNVRYYAGRNIYITRQLIHDLQEKDVIDMDDPVYEEKVKEVLGHKRSEVFGGCILGVLIAVLLYYMQ